jgi:AraC-like DNA-binding protein
MKLQVRYNINNLCKTLLQEQLDKLGLSCELTAHGEINVKRVLSDEQHKQLTGLLNKYEVHVLDDRIGVLVQKTKDAIIDMIYREEKLPASKVSFYLSEKLGYSFGYLSKLFSEVTYTSIENFIIIQKIERVKQLIIDDELNLTEIAGKLSYSSVAHLSGQFKKITGITPSAFQRIIKKRRNSGQISAVK